MEQFTKNQKGFTFIEVVVSIALLLVLAIGSVSANKLTTSGIKASQNRSKSNVLASEAMTAVMSIKSDDFSQISTGVFHPYHNGTKWTLVTGSETIGEVTRTVTITSVMRSLTCFTMVCDIVTQGGIVDPNSFYVEVKVTWDELGVTENLVLNSLITYWR